MSYGCAFFFFNDRIILGKNTLNWIFKAFRNSLRLNSSLKPLLLLDRIIYFINSVQEVKVIHKSIIWLNI